jgi:aspartate aminotransferase
MAEQKAVAQFLNNQPALEKYFTHFKQEVALRLKGLYDGFMQLKSEGFSVDAIVPQAAIYLTVQIDLKGRKKPDGKLIADQSEVTDYLLNEAKLAMVPFGFFGADRESSWYRISVGCCKKEEIADVINQLRKALAQLS